MTTPGRGLDPYDSLAAPSAPYRQEQVMTQLDFDVDRIRRQQSLAQTRVLLQRALSIPCPTHRADAEQFCWRRQTKGVCGARLARSFGRQPGAPVPAPRAGVPVQKHLEYSEVRS